MTSNTQSTSSQIPEIVKIEAKASPIAVKEITDIIDKTADKGTVVYGLRVLSKFGVPINELERIARRYNSRVSELTEPEQPYFRKDVPIISSYVTENKSGDFETRNLS